MLCYVSVESSEHKQNKKATRNMVVEDVMWICVEYQLAILKSSTVLIANSCTPTHAEQSGTARGVGYTTFP
jgi:hypothetical protein